MKARGIILIVVFCAVAARLLSEDEVHRVAFSACAYVFRGEEAGYTEFPGTMAANASWLRLELGPTKVLEPVKGRENPGLKELGSVVVSLKKEGQVWARADSAPPSLDSVQAYFMLLMPLLEMDRPADSKWLRVDSATGRFGTVPVSFEWEVFSTSLFSDLNRYYFSKQSGRLVAFNISTSADARELAAKLSNASIEQVRGILEDSPLDVIQVTFIQIESGGNVRNDGDFIEQLPVAKPGETVAVPGASSSAE